MDKSQLESITALSNYLSDAVYETLTTHDTLDKYQKLIQKYAEKANLEYTALKEDLDDFVALYEKIASDFVVSDFEEKSLLAQGKMTYIREDTVKKLVQFIKTAHKENDTFSRQEVRVPAVDGKKETATLVRYTKADQEFIQKDDVLCILTTAGKEHLLKSPASGRLFYKTGIGAEIPFGGTICEVSEEKRNGKFEYIWHDGTKYIGDFLEEVPFGKGKFFYANGDTYIGDVLEGKKNGSGKMEFANGDSYEGDWLADVMEGEGTFTIKSMEGFVLFESRKLHKGRATYALPQGETAFGYFENGKLAKIFDGTVLVTNGIPSNDKVAYRKFSNGDFYYGEFKGGEFHGKGFYHFAKKNAPTFSGATMTYYRGEFKKGQAQGIADLNYLHPYMEASDIETKVYKGQLLPLIFPFACHFEGDPKDGKGKVYTLQYELYEFISQQEDVIENMEDALDDLEDKVDKESKVKAQKLKAALEALQNNPNHFHFDFKKEREKAEKKEPGFHDFNALELDFEAFDTDDLKSDDPDDHRYYGVLEGNFQNFVPTGTMRFSTLKYQYVGEFANLKLHGQGTLTQGNRRWEGQFENNRFLYGKAFEDGKLVYEGGFTDFYLTDDFMNNAFAVKVGQYSGKGKLIRGESAWEGDFAEGAFIQGNVKLEVSIKSPLLSKKVTGIYTGGLEDGLPSGNGSFTWKEGTMDGEFAKGAFIEGKAIYGDLTMEGTFEAGNPVGKITLKNSTEKYSYEGEYAGYAFDGQGKINYQDGSFYEGSWAKGKKHGEGTEVNVQGERYEGEWKDDKKHGFGKLSLQNGDLYDGAFQANLYNGHGSLLSTNGDLYEGEWKAGKRHGEGTQYLKNEDKTLTGLWEDDVLVKDYNKKGFWQNLFGK